MANSNGSSRIIIGILATCLTGCILGGGGFAAVRAVDAYDKASRNTIAIKMMAKDLTEIKQDVKKLLSERGK